MWRRCIAYANDPERLFARFHHQVESTYVNRMITPARGKLNWANLSSALVLAFRVMLHIGILSDYRKPFWRAARHAMRRGQIDAVLGMGFIAHHLIQFTREALRGEQNASYYSTKMREAEPGRNWRPRCASRRNREPTCAGAPSPYVGASHPSFGSSVVDHSARSSTSLSVTVMTWVAPSIATWPKNCRPSLGGRFGVLGAFT